MISEDASLPDQVFGTFFGWAGAVNATAWTIKVVVNIGWKCCSCTKRKRLWVLYIHFLHIFEIVLFLRVDS